MKIRSINGSDTTKSRVVIGSTEYESHVQGQL